MTKWAATGKLVLSPDGSGVDLEASDARLVDTTNQSRGGKGGRVSAASQIETGAALTNAGVAAPKGRSAGATGATRASGEMTLARANTARAAMQARMLEQEFRVRAGELVDRAGYDRALADALGPMLAQIDTLSARLGSRCAAESDARKVQAIIDDEVVRIRQEIAARIRSLVMTGGATRQ